MGKNTKTHPNNAYIVSVQLDENTYHVFTEMRNSLRMSKTEAMKMLIYKAVWNYSCLLKDARKEAAQEAFGENIIEKKIAAGITPILKKEM